MNLKLLVKRVTVKNLTFTPKITYSCRAVFKNSIYFFSFDQKVRDLY